MRWNRHQHTADFLEPENLSEWLRKSYLPANFPTDSPEAVSKWAEALDLVSKFCPPKPLTPTEAAAKAAEDAESAQRTNAHHQKVLADMQATYKKKCEELIEYKAALDAQAQRAQECAQNAERAALEADQKREAAEQITKEAQQDIYRL